MRPNTENKTCRICGSTELETITTLLNHPMVTGPVTKAPKTVPTCDLEVGLCHRCGTCVLINTDTDRLPYDDEYTSSCVAYGRTKSVDEQTDSFIEFIRRADKAPSDKVLEIGCYDGALMRLLEARCMFNMLGCEPCIPAANEAREKGHNVRFGKFSANDYSELDMVIARNVLEHTTSPNQFVRDAASTLKRNGAFVVEVPAGEHYIRDGILGTIVPQHPCYFGTYSLQRLLGDHFKAATIEENRATICALASTPSHSGVRKEAVTDATQLRLGELKRQMRYDAARRAVEDETVDIFGANTCALELLSTGAIKTEQVDRVYDDDPHKWGRYLVNTDLVVSPRTALGTRKQRKVLVCSYTHRRSLADYITRQNNIAVLLYGDDE